MGPISGHLKVCWVDIRFRYLRWNFVILYCTFSMLHGRSIFLRGVKLICGAKTVKWQKIHYVVIKSLHFSRIITW